MRFLRRHKPGQAKVYFNDASGIGPDGFPYVIAFQQVEKVVKGAPTVALTHVAHLALERRAGIAVYRQSASEERPVEHFSLGAVAQLAQGDDGSADALPLPPIGPTDVLRVGAPPLDDPTFDAWFGGLNRID